MGIYRQLFLTFFKIGAFTFGGGWAMIAIIEKEVVDRHHWIRKDEFLDLIAIAQSVPGVLAVNFATCIGDRLKGMKGGIVAAIGTILPSFLLILAIAIFLTPESIKNNRVLSAIFMGIRPAVVALIIAPVITTAKSSKLTLSTAWIPALAAIMISLNIGVISNPITWIAIGGAGGYLHWEYTRRRIRKEPPAA
ncbi:MAG: chromate transporter [Bacteroidales bacterium]|nr:chromate transporter [Bacteroidales bacterium]